MSDPVDFIFDALRANAGVLKIVGEETLDKLEAEARSIYGGTDSYICRKKKLTDEELSERNIQIRREFNGQNLKAICRKYELGRSTLYRIVKRCEG